MMKGSKDGNEATGAVTKLGQLVENLLEEAEELREVVDELKLQAGGEINF